MKLFNKILVVALFAIVAFSSCKKDEIIVATAGKVGINIDHVWGSTNEEFKMKTELLHPALQEKMTFNTFRYYVSNVGMRAKDGSLVILPESYYIVDLSIDNGNELTLENVPAGEYTGVEIMFGVDSLKSVSGAQTGALSPAEGMFWSWNSGYIMIKAEGKAPTSITGDFVFHLGGFKGENKVQTTKTFAFDKSLVVNGSRNAEIYLIANPAKLWHGAEKLATKSNQKAPGVVAKSMSTNFYGGMLFDRIDN